jgi:hypothetical protein
MSKGTHKVVLYVHEKSKRFSITARLERARLRGVNKQMAGPSYTSIVLSENLEKQCAEWLRDRVRAACEVMGYTYQTRPQLS